MYTIADLFDLSMTIAAPLFQGKTYPWEVLGEISDFIKSLGATLPESEFDRIGEDIWIHKSAKVFDSAYIAGPCIIDEGTEVRNEPGGVVLRAECLPGAREVMLSLYEAGYTIAMVADSPDTPAHSPRTRPMISAR